MSSSKGSQNDDVDNRPSKKLKTEEKPFSLVSFNPNGFPSPDYLYHIGLNTKMDLKVKFNDMRCIIIMGSPERSESYANMWANLSADVPALIGKTERYAFYKVGSVVFVSHGMGGPSTSILLHELLKLLHYAQCPPIPIIRAGTCGGVGVAPGTIIVTTNAFNGELEEAYKFPILGTMISKPTDGFSSLLNDQLISVGVTEDNGNNSTVVKGKTMSCDCFYEGQGRLDGAFCDYTEVQKMSFLKRCHAIGIRNIEMEATVLGAFGKQSGLPVACVCAALINRMEGDQVKSSVGEMRRWTESVGVLLMRFLQKFIVGAEACQYSLNNLKQK